MSGGRNVARLKGKGQALSTGVLHTSPAEIHPRGWLDMQPEKEVLEELAGNENNAQ